MLSENKFSKYLLYAIGEIVLVVIGILIALQINNWNEAKQMDRWEQQFLENLQSELEGNHAQLKQVMDVQNKKGDAMEAALDLLQNADENDRPTIDSLYNAAQINPTFFPSTGVYDSGVSSGKIDELKDDALKFQIMNLYGHYYRRTVYNGEVLDDVVGAADHKEFRYFDRTAGKIKSWDGALSYEFKAIITEELKQNTVYTTISGFTLEELEHLITNISKELEHEDIP